MIIGVTGELYHGKDVVAAILAEKGFIPASLYDILKEQCTIQGIEPTEENLRKVRTELRARFGNAVLAERIMLRFESEKRYVVSGIDLEKEVAVFHQRNNTFLFYADATEPIVKQRTQLQEEPSLEERLDDFETEHKGWIQHRATYYLNNDGDVEKLREEINRLVAVMNVEKIKKIRPPKDKYYMSLAKEVAKRCTCLSVRFGAVIIKDDQQISSGYIGAPRKTADCLKRGYCLRRRLKIPSGQRYELCRSIHSEQNAIINAARSTVSLLDSTLYLWGARINEGQHTLIDMAPCFICKKMIINAGISKVVASKADGGMQVFRVEDWRHEWQDADMLDDIHQYSAGDYYNKDSKPPEE